MTPRQKAWDYFSELIRLYYADQNGYVRCYTCGAVGRWKGDRFQAGHFKAGRGNAVLFDRRQVRVQCAKCNLFLGGEQYKFGKRLEAELGEEAVKQIEQDATKPVKYTDQDYKRMIAEFKSEIKKLKSEKGL
jgi:hypothetical protein